MSYNTDTDVLVVQKKINKYFIFIGTNYNLPHISNAV